MKLNPVIVSIVSVVITLGSIYMKDRIGAISDIGNMSQRQELLVTDVKALQVKQEEQAKIFVAKEEFKRVEEAQKNFLTREEANLQFRAIAERLDAIQSDLREIGRNVNKR